MDKQYINKPYAPKVNKCNQCWKDIWPQMSVVINKEIACCTLCVTLFETEWTSNWHCVTISYRSRKYKKTNWYFANGNHDHLMDMTA